MRFQVQGTRFRTVSERFTAYLEADSASDALQQLGLDAETCSGSGWVGHVEARNARALIDLTVDPHAETIQDEQEFFVRRVEAIGLGCTMG